MKILNNGKIFFSKMLGQKEKEIIIRRLTRNVDFFHFNGHPCVEIHDVYGDIYNDLLAIQTNLEDCGNKIIGGYIEYDGIHTGGYEFTDEKWKELSASEVALRHATSEELVEELLRRGCGPDYMLAYTKRQDSNI